MKNSNKILIIIHEGVSLRNFLYSNIHKKMMKNSIEVKYWSNLKYEFVQHEAFKLEITRGNLTKWSEIIKKIRIRKYLYYFAAFYNDDRFLLFDRPWSGNKFVKKIVLSIMNALIGVIYIGERVFRIKYLINFFERRSVYYKSCVTQLRNEQPSFVFNTSQRSSNSICQLLAAQDLNIPTATFIYSWDNLPKGTLVVDADYYFVWSNHMKNELIKYYQINPAKIRVTGTPQFELHFDKKYILPKNEYFDAYQLNPELEYICFSGDDITTSPYDPYYLRDIAQSVVEINKKSKKKLGIIFRRCPVDHSDRYDFVLKQFHNLIYPVNPAWESTGSSWNTVFPTYMDQTILVSTIAYTLGVFNVGSSMIFDYVTHNKPCAYLNYNVTEQVKGDWDIHNIYKYIHFDSMPSDNCVLWINKKEDLKSAIGRMIRGEVVDVLKDAKTWFNVVNKEPHYMSTNRIIDNIQRILNEETENRISDSRIST